jgi:hypothetical protein
VRTTLWPQNGRRGASWVIRFFYASGAGLDFLHWWANSFSGLYQALLPSHFMLGPPNLLVQLLGLSFGTIFNLLGLAAGILFWNILDD